MDKSQLSFITLYTQAGNTIFARWPLRTDNCDMGEELLEESGTVLRRGTTSQSCQIDEVPIQKANSRCRWLYVVGYLGIFYYVIMGIIYILIQYTLIVKSQFNLQCNQTSLTCLGTINNINSQDRIFIQLASSCPTDNIDMSSLQILNITLLNSTNFDESACCQLKDQEYANSYPYFRHLFAVCTCNLINNYNIAIQFNNTIPEPFMDNLSIIMRQAYLFDQDQTINQAIICLIFASCVAFFNISSKIMESEDNALSNAPIPKIKEKIHKIYLKPPVDIEQIDDNLENIREIALNWTLKCQKKSLQFSESDSEFSWLST